MFRLRTFYCDLQFKINRFALIDSIDYIYNYIDIDYDKYSADTVYFGFG